MDLNTKTQSLIDQSDLLETITVIRFELKAFMLYETLLLVTAAQIKSQLFINEIFEKPIKIIE